MGKDSSKVEEDAVDASRALGITLTKRGQHTGLDIPMCGVPVHAADDYLQRLISVGFLASKKPPCAPTILLMIPATTSLLVIFKT